MFFFLASVLSLKVKLNGCRYFSLNLSFCNARHVFLSCPLRNMLSFKKKTKKYALYFGRPKRTFNFGLGAVTDVKVCMADSVPVRLSLNGSFRAWKSSVPVQISEEIVQPGFLPMQTNGASRRFASNIKECMDDSRRYARKYPWPVVIVNITAIHGS